MITYLKNILQLVLAPGFAWEDISREGKPSESLFYGNYIPLSVIVALSAYMQLIYHHGTVLSLSLMALATFITLFVSHYIAVVALRSFMPSCLTGQYNVQKFNTVTVYSQSIFALLVLLNNVLPTHLSVVYLLMVAIALIVWKAAIYLTVATEKEFKFVIVASASILAPPMILLAFFSDLIA